jgi:orotate phosphoribosyltransferase-like protein
MNCNPLNHSSCITISKTNNSKLGNDIENLYNRTEFMKSLAMNLTKEMQDLKMLTEETTRLVVNRFTTKYKKTNTTVVQDDFIDLITHGQQLKSISNHVNSITNNMNNVKEELNTIIALHSMLETIQNLLNNDQ